MVSKKAKGFPARQRALMSDVMAVCCIICNTGWRLAVYKHERSHIAAWPTACACTPRAVGACTFIYLLGMSSPQPTRQHMAASSSPASPSPFAQPPRVLPSDHRPRAPPGRGPAPNLKKSGLRGDAQLNLPCDRSATLAGTC
jgi:hypothetical protein